ncbi:hypothetical protein EWH99_10790 [Sporolactobacillus sp. THM7-7]|nr:hypothetical protein EWH99_10790 [Sporolactobacillus sp. THM7-7]
METFMENVVDPAVVTLITALVAYLLKVGLPALIDLLLKSKAATLVKAAESLFPDGGAGAEKYQWVADQLQAYAKKLLTRVKDDRLRVYIEAAVTELHAELPASLGAAKKQIEESK